MVQISNPFKDLLSSPVDRLGPSSGDAGRSFTIEETGVASPRRITLRGRAMPYRGVGWGGTQRTKKTVYPGNPVATQQVLGPDETNTTLEGMWKDRFMAGAIDIGDAGGGGGQGALQAAVGAAADALGLNGSGPTLLAEEVVRLFHDLRRAGTVLRVQYLSEVRFGILVDFTATYDRPQDIKWSAEFEWQAWDDNAPLRSAEEPTTKADLLSDLNTFLDIVAQAPAVLQRLEAQLGHAIDGIASQGQILVNALRTADALTDLPGSVIGQMIGSSREFSAQVSDLMRQVLDVRLPTITGAQDVAGPYRDPTTQVRFSSPTKQRLEAERWRKVVGAALRNLRRTADDAVTQRLSQRLPRTTRIVVVAQGASLYDLATKFYGSPDFATYLAAVNKLTGANVPSGFQLRVPPKPTGPTGLSPSRGRDCQECC